MEELDVKLHERGRGKWPVVRPVVPPENRGGDPLPC